MCGVFGIRAPERDVARVTFFGLFALQHRGQESAGIAVSDRGRLTVLRDMGLVAQVFNEQNLSGLQGEVAIGHTRYSTTGSTQWTNAQPIVQHGKARTVTLGHNGNLTNVEQLRERARRRGSPALDDLRHRGDRGARSPTIRLRFEDAIANAMRRLEGAFTVVALAEGKLVGFRDPHGFRPLNLGRIDGDPVLASETCALDLVGAEHEREIAPGRARPDRRRRRRLDAGSAAGRGRRALPLRVHLSRPPRLDPRRHRGARGPRQDGRAARRGAPASTRTLVMPAPDSGTPAAIGFARASGIPFSEGLIKNRYVGRTFIEPDQGASRAGHPPQVQPALRGRGQAGRARRRLDRPREHDAARSSRCSSRPERRRCTFGSRRRRSSRPASTGSTSPTRSSSSPRRARSSEVREQIGATSLAYLSLEGVQAATTRPADEFCRACFTRRLSDARPGRQDAREVPLRA